MADSVKQNEIVTTPREAIDLLRRVPESVNVSRLAYERAIEVLELFVRELHE